MNRNLKKMWPAVAASLVAVTSILSAADDMQMRNLENRVSALEQKKCANGMINPPGRPQVKDGWDVFVTAEFLWWKATEGGLGFAIKDKDTCKFCTGSDATDYSDLVLTNGKLATPDFDWDPGFKVGLGYNMMHDDWDVYVDWTRFHTTTGEKEINAKNREESCCQSAECQTLYTTWINPKNDDCCTGDCVDGLGADETQFAEEAESSWRLNLDLLDAELGREFYVSKWLTLRPFAGLRSAWINQLFKVEYENESAGFLDLSPPDDLANFSKEKIKMKNRFWGMGPRFGIDTNWGLGWGFGIYGDFALSLLYGKFRVTEEVETLVGSNGAGSGCGTGCCDDDDCDQGLEQCCYHPWKAKEVFHEGVAIADLEIGLAWDWMFADDAFHVGIWAGWEQHMFWDQNQFFRFVDPQHQGVFTYTNGNLTTQGLTTGLRFDF